MNDLKIYSYGGIYLGQHISEFYSTLIPENIFFQGMGIFYVFQKDNVLRLKRKNNIICDENTIAFLEIDIGCMKVVRIYILKKNKDYKFLDNIKIGTIIDKNLKNMLELELEDYEGWDLPEYYSKKYKELHLDFDYNFDDGIETIRGISFFLNSINLLEYYKKIKIKNIIECKKIEDIYDYYYDGSVECKEFKIDLKHKRISFMINEYEFTFNLLTREIKKIYDTKKMEEIKISEIHSKF